MALLAPFVVFLQAAGTPQTQSHTGGMKTGLWCRARGFLCLLFVGVCEFYGLEKNLTILGQKARLLLQRSAQADFPDGFLTLLDPGWSLAASPLPVEPQLQGAMRRL